MMNKPEHSFPEILARPVSLIPDRIHASLICPVLNRLFSGEIGEGELDFLTGRNLQIEVMDARIRFTLGFDGKQLSPVASGQSPHVTIRGKVHDFLLLIARREDSDTLFFRRRLQLEGDTELGLAIKNFLDAIEIESLPCYQQMNALMDRSIQLYERVT